MTYSEIYETALRLVSETGSSISDDYEERAPYLLGTFVSEQIPLQKRWDRSHGEEEGSYSANLCVNMSEDFPLSDEFLTPATYYLAAMLVIDENETMSDRFFDRYADGIASIEATLPVKSEKIVDVYGAWN